MSNSILYTKSSGMKVTAAVEAILPALADHSPPDVVIACLVIAIILQAPDIEPSKLIEGVKDISEHIALYLTKDDIGTIN